MDTGVIIIIILLVIIGLVYFYFIRPLLMIGTIAGEVVKKVSDTISDQLNLEKDVTDNRMDRIEADKIEQKIKEEAEKAEEEARILAEQNRYIDIKGKYYIDYGTLSGLFSVGPMDLITKIHKVYNNDYGLAYILNLKDGNIQDNNGNVGIFEISNGLRKIKLGDKIYANDDKTLQTRWHQDTIYPNSDVLKGARITSKDGRYTALVWKHDGNLCIYKTEDNSQIYCTGPSPPQPDGAYALLNNGNFIGYKNNTDEIFWSSDIISTIPVIDRVILNNNGALSLWNSTYGIRIKEINTKVDQTEGEYNFQMKRRKR